VSLAESAAAEATVIPLGTPGTLAPGAEVRGVDLSRPIDPGTADLLRAAWRDHQVIVLRGQSLSPDDQMRFCVVFGDIGRRARPIETRNEPQGAPDGMMFVSNLKVDGKNIGSLPDGEMQFHIDQIYTERPAMGTSLYALEVPRLGGDTLFANLYAAYDRLTAATQRRIAGLKAVHYFDYGNLGATTRDAVTQAARDDATRAARDSAPHAAHPIVRTHPTTGRKALFVCRLMTGYIENMAHDESDALLEELFEQVERPDIVYAHRWRAGDLLLWDNRCTVHARTDFDPGERRHLRRFTIQGDRPV
jgi:taurine dioxygenase